MGIRVSRYSQTTRDANEHELVKLWKQLGGQWWQSPPLDGWALSRGVWVPTEIKLPEREGTANEYTPSQRRFLGFALQWRGPIFIWRTQDDVIRDAGGRVTAGR